MIDPPDVGLEPPIMYDESKKLSIITTGPKYLIMKRIDKDNEIRDNKENNGKEVRTLANVSPFLIKKVVDSTCGGEVETCKKLRNGTILIKTKNSLQANKLIQLSSLSPTIKIEVSEHNSLNFVRGVIYSNDLRRMSEDEILDELKSQNVYKVNKIMSKTKNDNIKETGLIIVTFYAMDLPYELLIGYERVKIRPYIPLPLKCKYCLRFGHHFKYCNDKKLCSVCSNDFHIGLETNEVCTQPASCINCKENNNENSNHSPNNKTCPVFLKEKEIQSIITLEKVNKATAVKKYHERDSLFSNNNVELSKTSTNNISSQSAAKTITTTNNQYNYNTISTSRNSMPLPITNSSSTSGMKLYEKGTDSAKNSSQTGEMSSQSTESNKNILPPKTSKRQQNFLKKALVESTTKRPKRN